MSLSDTFEHSASDTLIVTEKQIRSLLGELPVRSALENMFRALGDADATQPPQTLTLFPQGRGDFITYPGAIGSDNVFGAKLSPYIITADRPVITAWTVLMSMETGLPLMLCDSGLLTVERTAGTTALAVDYLANRKALRLAVIGAGAVAQAHIRHVAPLRNWQQISVFAPDLSSDERKTAALLRIDDRIKISESVHACVNSADVIMLCTSSGTPVITQEALTNAPLITSISTNVPRAHEVEPSWLPKMDVYCDYRNTTPQNAGEMVLAVQEHGWEPAQVRGDLPELARGICRLPAFDRPVFFRSIGLGLEDIAVANALYQLLHMTRSS
jgi:L-arginine dehydrogenase